MNAAAIAPKGSLVDPRRGGQIEIRVLPVGQPLVATAGLGDGKGPGGMRVACYRLPVESERAYRITVAVNRAISGAFITDGCQLNATVLGYAEPGGARDDKLIVYRTHDVGAGERFLRVNLWGRGKTYNMRLELVASTPNELAAFDAEVRRAKEARLMAQQQQRQQQSGGDNVFGRALGGALMGAMLGGGGQNSVDLAVTGAQAAAQGGNPLQVLNSMGDVAAANAAESKRQLDETIARAQAQGEAQAEARRLANSTTARNGASLGGISQDTRGPLPEGDNGEGSVKVVTRESVSQSRTPLKNGNCPFEPVVQAEGCDGFERVKVYGHFTGISMVSREAAEAQAMGECAKAGKSCRVVEVTGGNGIHWRVEVAYWTGEYRRVSKGASSVSSE